MRWIKLLLMVALGVFLFNLANSIPLPGFSTVEGNDQKDQSEVEIKSAILLVMESYPMKVSLAL